MNACNAVGREAEYIVLSRGISHSGATTEQFIGRTYQLDCIDRPAFKKQTEVTQPQLPGEPCSASFDAKTGSIASRKFTALPTGSLRLALDQKPLFFHKLGEESGGDFVVLVARVAEDDLQEREVGRRAYTR